MNFDLPKTNTTTEQTKAAELNRIAELRAQLNEAENKVMSSIPVPKPSTTESSVYANIPKKTAALEVIKHLSLAKNVGIGYIISVFLILLAATFHNFAAYGVAVLVIIPAALYIQRTNAELKRLKLEYNL